MKKTLVAMAVLAASGASFGQVVLSGNIGPSYQMSPIMNYDTAVAGASRTRAQGLQIQDGELNVTATEDLGGGWKAVAKGGWTVRGRDTGVVTRDATVTLVTPMGALTAGAMRTCGPWESMMTGVVTGPLRSGNEGSSTDAVANAAALATPLPKCALIDVLVYSVPVGPVAASVAYGEFSNNKGVAAGNNTGLTFTQLAGTYTSGALMVGLDATFFTQAAGSSELAAGRSILDGLVRTRLVGTYNFGVAKVGLGYQTITNNIASTMTASLTVPMGPVVFGLEYAARDAQGFISNDAGARALATGVFGATNGDKASSEVGLGATYSFSKSTSLNTSYIVYNDAGANSISGAPKKLEDEYRVRLMKTF